MWLLTLGDEDLVELQHGVEGASSKRMQCGPAGQVQSYEWFPSEIREKLFYAEEVAITEQKCYDPSFDNTMGAVVLG